MDDSPFNPHRAPDDRRDAQLDRLLQAWFQQLLAEAPPPRLVELIDRLDAASGM
jgi:hypothetical protein